MIPTFCDSNDAYIPWDLVTLMIPTFRDSSDAYIM